LRYAGSNTIPNRDPHSLFGRVCFNGCTRSPEIVTIDGGVPFTSAGGAGYLIFESGRPVSFAAAISRAAAGVGS
jgi:hypothetical protein